MIRLAVRCQPELAEAVLAELTAIYPDGVEESEGPGYVEYALYGAPGELPALPQIEAVAGRGLVEVSTSEIPDDWADRWRDFHSPRSVGGRLHLRPPWMEPADDARLLDVVIDPGRAFGTGSHATTALCLELLCDLAGEGLASGGLADWGTGSGVLAVAAARLGWSPVSACDNDVAALEHASANAAANGVALALSRCDVRAQAPPAADTVTANLTAPLLEAAAAQLARPPKRLVCSGLLTGEYERVLAAFARHELREERRRSDGDWGALVLRRAATRSRSRAEARAS